MDIKELSAQPREAIPRHVAVVMDGNGRWAKKRFLPRVAGHKKGVDSVRAVIQAAAESGVRHLSLFAFSSENWNRPADEVSALMNLFLTSLAKETSALHKANVRIRMVGDLSRFPDELQKKIAESHKLTENNTGLTLNICVNYGGRWEIIEACKAMMKKGVASEDVTEELFARNLQIGDSGDVDLLSEPALKAALVIFSCGSLPIVSSTLPPFYGRILVKKNLKKHYCGTHQEKGALVRPQSKSRRKMPINRR